MYPRSSCQALHLYKIIRHTMILDAADFATAASTSGTVATTGTAGTTGTATTTWIADTTDTITYATINTTASGAAIPNI